MTHEEFLNKYYLGRGYWICPCCGDTQLYGAYFHRHLLTHNTTLNNIYIELVNRPCVICGTPVGFTKPSKGINHTCGSPQCMSENRSRISAEGWSVSGRKEEASARALTQWKNPEFSNKVKSALKSVWNNPEHREFMSKISRDTLRATRQTPQYQEAMSRAKELWKDLEFLRDTNAKAVLQSTLARYSDKEYLHCYIIKEEGFKVGITSNLDLRTSGRELFSHRTLRTDIACKLEFLIKMNFPIDERFRSMGNGWTEWRGMEHMEDALILFNLREEVILEMTNIILGDDND